MARSISEQELQLKKRARRRLVGAIVLVTAVAVVLPMVLDSEPKPVRQTVDIHIPSPEAGEFKPRTSEATQQAAAPIKGLPETPSHAPPAETAASASTPAVQAPTASSPAADAPALRLSDATDRTPPAPAREKEPSETARASTQVEATAPQRPASGDRQESARSASGAAKAKPESFPRSDNTRGAGSAPAAKSQAARAAGTTDRTDGARAPARASSSKSEASARAGSGNENTRNTSASSKRGDGAGDSGGYVVQVAALADPAKARQLQKQMSGTGLRTYTEVVSTKAGEMTRVRAGPYATREAAEKARAQLKKAGLDGQVVAK